MRFAVENAKLAAGKIPIQRQAHQAAGRVVLAKFWTGSRSWLGGAVIGRRLWRWQFTYRPTPFLTGIIEIFVCQSQQLFKSSDLDETRIIFSVLQVKPKLISVVIYVVKVVSNPIRCV